MSALTEVIALGADMGGITINGTPLPFSAIALVAFVVFVVLIAWQLWELNNKLHTDQKQLTIAVNPSHLNGTDDLPAHFSPHTDGTSLVAVGFLTITVRNAAHHDIRIGEMFVEAYRKTKWQRTETAPLPFVVWGDKDTWYDEPHRKRVEWKIPAQSPASAVDAEFQDDIPGGIGKEYKLRLVATVGRPDRRIEVPFYP